MLKKLSRLGHITLVTFPGRHGTAIYLKNYLSTMFQISDVMVDKAEVALSLNIKLLPPDAEPEAAERSACGPMRLLFVSKAFMDNVAQNVLQLLERQGVACSRCPRCSYQLYPLSGDGKGECVGKQQNQPIQFRMEVLCGTGEPRYVFVLSISIQQEGVNEHG